MKLISEFYDYVICRDELTKQRLCIADLLIYDSDWRFSVNYQGVMGKLIYVFSGILVIYLISLLN